MFYFAFDLNPGNAETIVIKVNGKIYAEVSLSQEKDIEIYHDDGTLMNIVRIKEKKAYMIYANCPDKRCMRQNYFIACLPNRVTIEITGGKNDKNDKFDVVI